MPVPIAAPPFFGQIFINDSGDREGWSEGYWLRRAATYEDAVMTLDTVIWERRRALLDSDAECVGLRVSNSSVFGDTRVRVPEFKRSQGTYNVASASFSQDTPTNLCLYLRWETDVETIRSIKPIRGIPDAVLSHSASAVRKYEPPSLFAKRLDNFIADVVNQCSVVSEKRTNRTTLKTGTITVGDRVITSIDPTGLFIGQKIQGRQFPAFAQIDSIGTETVVMDRQAIITQTAAHLNFIDTKGTTISAHEIKRCIIPAYFRYHKTGRPFGLLRGRAAVKKAT